MATAFSNALRVRIERAVTSPRMSAKSALTLARTSANFTGLISFFSVTAAGEQVIGTHMPSASMTVAIVHAGFAITRLDEESANETLRMFADLGILEEELGTA